MKQRSEAIWLDMALVAVITLLLMVILFVPKSEQRPVSSPVPATVPNKSTAGQMRALHTEQPGHSQAWNYIVKENDTLSQLVIRFCGRLDALANVVRDNALSNPNRIYPHQTLVFKGQCVPSPETAKTQNVFPGKFTSRGGASQEKRFLHIPDPEKQHFRETLLNRLPLRNAECLYMKYAGTWKENTLRRIACIRENYGDVITKAAVQYRLPPLLIEAIIHQESGGRPDARSSTGCKGIMQFESRTAQEYGVTDVYDPFESIPKGARVLSEYIRHFGGSLDRGIAAYNQGPGTVRKLEDQGHNTSMLPYVVEVKKVLRLLESQKHN